MLNLVVENRGSPIFWEILIAIGVVAVVTNTLIYRRTHITNDERRNLRLKGSIVLTIGWIALCIARLLTL